MDWNQIVGQENLKDILKQNILENRLSHAQLFLGKAGYGKS
jgi:DNA polymerase-3 subunit delta'